MEERTGSFKPVKKKRGRFNAVDILIILLIVGVIVIFAASTISVSEEPGEKTKFEYTMTIEGVSKDFLDLIENGERVYDSSSKNFLGTVSSVDGNKPYGLYEYDKTTGEMVVKEYPEKYNITFTVSAKAQFVEGVGYTVGGQRIAVGQNMELRFPDFVANAYCVGMREVE